MFRSGDTSSLRSPIPVPRRVLTPHSRRRRLEATCQRQCLGFIRSRWQRRGTIMIRAAIVGLGWWGQSLVNSVRGSEAIRFTTAHTRNEDIAAAFCTEAALNWVGSLDSILTDKSIDAVV